MIRKKIYSINMITIDQLRSLLSDDSIKVDKKKNTLRAIINTENTSDYICNYFYKNHNLYDDFYAIIKIRHKNDGSAINLSVKHNPFTLSWLIFILLGLFDLTYLYLVIYYGMQSRNSTRGYIIVVTLMCITLPFFKKIHEIRKKYITKIYENISLRITQQ